jgi:hypothetical protein
MESWKFIYLFIYFWAEMCRSCLPNNTLLNLITHLFYISFRNGYHDCCRVVCKVFTGYLGFNPGFFFFSILWCSWKWRSSIIWFRQIWLQTRYERILKKESFYILGYLLELTIKIWRIWAIFLSMENPLYRLESLFSGQNLVKIRPDKTLISSNPLVGYLRLSNVIGT